MIEALIPGEPIEFILPEDRKSEKPTIWLIKQLSIKEEEYLSSLALRSTKGKNSIAKSIEYVKTALHIGLLGAKNFLDKDGKDAKWERLDKSQPVIGNIKPWSEETLVQIEKKYREKIALKVVGHDLDEAEAKN